MKHQIRNQVVAIRYSRLLYDNQRNLGFELVSIRDETVWKSQQHTYISTDINSLKFPILDSETHLRLVEIDIGDAHYCQY